MNNQIEHLQAKKTLKELILHLKAIGIKFLETCETTQCMSQDNFEKEKENNTVQ